MCGWFARFVHALNLAVTPRADARQVLQSENEVGAFLGAFNVVNLLCRYWPTTVQVERVNA